MTALYGGAPRVPTDSRSEDWNQPRCWSEPSLRFEERGLEPAAGLVRALDVNLRRPPELGPRLEDGGVAAPRVEPDVEDIGLLREPVAAALGAARPGGEESAGRTRVPLIGTLALAKDPRDVVDDPLLEEQRSTPRAVERDDRHPPDPLARDDPLGPVRHHVVDALLAPRRDPLHVALDRLEDARAEALLVELDEPLLRGTEERRVLAAPAVRIRVVEPPLGNQHPDRPEVFDDPRVGLPDGEPRKVLHSRDEAAVIVHRVEDRQSQ